MISVSDHTSGNFLVPEIRELFSETGKLSESADFEYRPEQQQMAVEVAEALVRARPLVVEAGTGVGKSLAYLVPAMSMGLEHCRKVVVSTHTINLQEQLIRKDIPIVKTILERDFKAVLFKGRGNFLCTRRLEMAMRQSGDLFNSSENTELAAIYEWSQRTEDGSLADLDFTPQPGVWAQICSEPHICTPKGCGQRCFYQKLRRQVQAADVVVVNHMLLFTLLGSQEELEGEGGEGLLFPNDLAILDEAHTLENVAAKQLGMNASRSGIRFVVNRLYNPRSRKGLFQANRDLEGARIAEDLLHGVDHFFDEVEDAAHFKANAREVRIREPGLVEDQLSERLLRAQQAATNLAERIDREGVSLELRDIASRLREARLAVGSFVDLSAEEHVYWVERSGHELQNVSLHAAPLDLCDRLRNLFFLDGRSCILTSATLGVGDRDMAYFRNRVGAESTRAVQIGSPFDYKKQMTLYLLKDIAPPNHDQYETQLGEWIEHFLEVSQGHAFVLFTSYRLMERMATALESAIEEQGWELLVQGRSGTRSQILERFKKAKSGVLFGTDSFWTGVDVPGKALTNVIITRLPFAVPDHPLTEARLEQITERGGNAFTEYSVPEAILKLRQGIGRLIRSKRDQGIAAILDNRILGKAYGKAFLRALPDADIEILGESARRRR